MKEIGLKRALTCSYEEALAKLPDALKAEGFGILTTIDMKETLKQKLGVDFRRYTILGACNPPLAHQALSEHLGFGLMMPCNVTVHESDEGRAVVQAVDPSQTVAAQVSPAMAELTQTIRSKLQKVLAGL